MPELNALVRRVSSVALLAAFALAQPALAQETAPAAAPPAADAAAGTPAPEAAPDTGIASLLNQQSGGSAEDAKPVPSEMEPRATNTLINAVTEIGSRLVAVGAWGHVLISEDQGNSWTQVQTPVNVTLTSIEFVDDKLGFATGHDAVILRTEDGGKTWALVNFQPTLESPLFDLHMKDQNTGFAIGAYSLVFVTADGGKTWTQKQLGDLDFHLNAIATGKDGKVWIAGEAGHVFATDAGLSQLQDIETPYSGSFWNVLALKDGSVLAMGLRGNVWRTTDGGATWTQAPTGTIASIQSGIELQDGGILLVGLEGTVLISKDRGASFTAVKRTERTALSTAFQTKDGKILLFGEAGVGAPLTN